jgi:2'-phosphotransferase
MGRQHIHMAKGLPGEVISGMRQNSEVVIQINVTDAIKAGIRFFESDNGVILSDGIDGGGVIPAQFLKRIH